MSKVSGVVQEVKEITTKTNKVMYQMKVGGTFYGTMLKKEANQGDLVEFDAEQNGNFWNAKNVVNKGKAPIFEASSPARKASGAQNDTMSKEDWEKKDLRIARQGCRNSANSIVVALLEHGLLPEPKAKNKNIVDVALEYSDLITNRFYDDVVNLGAKPKIEAKDTSPKDPDDELE